MNDVCVVLQDTYPHTIGGVSTWVQRLMHGLPDLSFAVAHLNDGDRDGTLRTAYAPPSNLCHVELIALDPERDLCAAGSGGELPAARIYHAISSGAPAVVAADAAQRRGSPFVLTEHGLAWHEAALGIAGCKPHLARSRPRPAQLRARARALAACARIAYAQADAVTSVCAVNVATQLAAGAPTSRCSLIPNAAPAEVRAQGPSRCADMPGRLAESSSPAHAGARFRVALIGRVVPVKDVMCFLRAGAILAAEHPGCELLVVGPLDHDLEYAHACARLARELEIDQQVRFTGTLDVDELYTQLDAVALSSVSEAQPLVLIEAMAAGVPVVATAVGGCPELLRGAGLLVPPADHMALSRALLALAREPALRARMSAAGRTRARSAHSPQAVYARYRELYERALDRS